MQIVADCNVAARGGGGSRSRGRRGGGRGIEGGDRREIPASKDPGGNGGGRGRNQTSRHRVEGVSTERGRLLCAQTIPVRRCAGSHGAGGRAVKDEMKGVPWTRKRDPGRVREKGGTER